MAEGTLSLVTAAACEPISVELAKAHCRITSSDEDALVEGWIASAREWIEGFTGRQLIGATWDLSLDEFPCGALALRKAPLRSVTHVKYLDGDGTEQTASASLYRVKTFAGPHARPGHLSLEYAQAWPVVRPVRDAVTIRFVGGYSNQLTSPTAAQISSAQAAVPMQLRQAMLLCIAEFDAQRRVSVVGSNVVEAPMAAINLAAPFRVYPCGAV